MYHSLAFLVTEKHSFLKVTKCVPWHTVLSESLSLVLPFAHPSIVVSTVKPSLILQVPPQLPLYYSPYFLLTSPSFLLATKLEKKKNPRSCQAMASFLTLQPWRSSTQCLASNTYL